MNDVMTAPDIPSELKDQDLNFRSELRTLLPVMRQLDSVLERAVTIAKLPTQGQSSPNPSKGFTIDPADIEKFLIQQPGNPLFSNFDTLPVQFPSQTIPPNSRLAWVQHRFGLLPFEMDAIILALAPEFDMRYGQLFAFLQNDAQRQRPSIDLALNLLCPNADAKLLHRASFTEDAPLIRQGLLSLSPQPRQEQLSSLGLILKLDPQLSRFLLGLPGLSPELERFCELIEPTAELDSVFVSEQIKTGLSSLFQSSESQPLSLYLKGDRKLGQKALLEALCRKHERYLISVDLEQVIDAKEDPLDWLRRITGLTQLYNAVLYIEGWDVIRPESSMAKGTDAIPPADKAQSNRPAEQKLAEALPKDGIVAISGQKSWQLSVGRWLTTITIPVTKLDFEQRRECWKMHLEAHQIKLKPEEINILSDRFRFTSEQIHQAIARAKSHQEWQEACLTSKKKRKPWTVNELLSAAREQSGQDLSSLARKITPKQTWDNLVLAKSALSQLQELCNQAHHHTKVYKDWGFGKKLSSGKGLTVLFSGSPGTGKTLAAEIIAHELQLDLYKIDLSQMVSKYIGETEKNLNRVFNAAEQSNAILLFDEADAIFGKRSEVKDAHDRYANLEVAYLLQKMEEYEGMSILTSNLQQNLDDAFVRRLSFIIEFPFPDEASRLELWQNIWPSEAPLKSEIDLEQLAKKFKLAGGNIRNIALASAFLAASQDQAIDIDCILQATQREFQKMGRLLNEQDFSTFKAH